MMLSGVTEAQKKALKSWHYGPVCSCGNADMSELSGRPRVKVPYLGVRQEPKTKHWLIFFESRIGCLAE